MNRRWLGYLVFGVVAYLVFLVATVPASWLAWGLRQLTDGIVAIDQGQGSLWHGTGRLIVYHPRATARDLGKTEWRINPLWLPAARLQLYLQAIGSESKITGKIGVTPSKIIIQDSRVSASAQFASELYAPAKLLSPKGQLRLDAKQLTLERSGVQGNAQLFWNNAGSGLSSVQPLGDYRVDVTGKGESAVLKLTTLRGALEVNGQGRWQILKGGELQLNGFARAKTRTQELEPLLKLLGRSRGGGRRSFRLKTRLALPFGPSTPSP
ncbi:MAG: type II secretion system protein N [Acidiferrobacterales bacterium]